MVIKCSYLKQLQRVVKRFKIRFLNWLDIHITDNYPSKNLAVTEKWQKMHFAVLSLREARTEDGDHLQLQLAGYEE